MILNSKSLLQIMLSLEKFHQIIMLTNLLDKTILDLEFLKCLQILSHQVFCSNIVNKSITSGKFPSVWKEAKFKPFYKAGSKEDVNN